MKRGKIKAGPFTLDFSQKTYVMGILNVTPDSFSDGGKHQRLDQAVDHAARMIADGADIIDIGGESTRPGSTPVPEEEELERVIPVVEALASRFDVPLSIDTYKANVAKEALEKGAHIINDVWGAKADKSMAQVAKETGAPIILMHNRHNKDYQHLIRDMINDLYESIHLVRQAGVKEEQIILDPGIGFAKTYEHNLEVMRSLDTFTTLGYPVLLGTSRKSMIGHTLNLPVDQRVEGTIATVCLGIAKGCDIVRVHDVKEVCRAVKMMDVMLGRKGGGQHR
ncbi:dihydropteroate synthase [Caldalkalibacillus thermarum TA2.A1]|uniref:Dihydropteroate synthase n=1 Tax=Caldalkalibacillus thermarum (strain TA2.A1) TaxID=986075 RepID=F5L3A0_CALTT|nr:dihydropteroate synthase [Caldalkalibacillus thermarum]EGL84189.1 dihydropteroate synthase [Caldalkalibacillus thermarum TA2.A1]QZT34375.1 dihydropteroate synthase [Caldalkalibacillus thermarum TA2.A1]